MPKKLFEIQTDKIENGTNLMRNNPKLTSWKGDLSSLTNGDYMFWACSELASFTGNLSSLTSGSYMFYSCSELNSFAADSSGSPVNLGSLTSGSYMFQNCTKLTTFNCNDLSSLSNGSWMFRGCTRLTTFSTNLGSLTNGEMMFNNCIKLATFTSDLSSLSDGNNMFYGCSELKSFNSDLSSLNDGNNMFYYCEKLASFTSKLGSLTNGNLMFRGCTNLATFTSDLSSLTNGGYMFEGCKLNAPSVQNIALTINKITNNARFDIGVDTSIASDAQVKRDLGLIKHTGWNLYVNGSTATSNYTLPKYAGCTTTAQVKAKDSNYKTSGIVNGVWVEYLPDLQSVTISSNINEGLFYNTSALTTWIIPLPSLTIAQYMFCNCTNLTSFTGDLSSLTNGNGMFYNSSKLSTFTSDLSSLGIGVGMFWTCTALKSFTTDLKSLTCGTQMFYNCTNLTTFTSNLNSLTNGYQMFYGCKLNTSSIKKIADTIKNVSKLTNSTGDYAMFGEVYKTIHIGITNSSPSTTEKGYLNTIANKGWTVYVNGSTYTPTSTASIMTLDELGNEVETPIPFYAKPIPSDEEHGDYVDSEGNYYIILGAQFIYGDDLSTYGMFTSEADAAANMRLTKVER